MQTATTTYQGAERRQHQVYVTQNTEYHVRGGQVVAVRRRSGGGWLATHAALSMRVMGVVRRNSWLPREGVPGPGDRLYLAHNRNDVVTSPVLEVARPPKDVVSQYPTPVS
jgi:hypothetical protein